MKNHLYPKVPGLEYVFSNDLTNNIKTLVRKKMKEVNNCMDSVKNKRLSHKHTMYMTKFTMCSFQELDKSWDISSTSKQTR